MDWTIWLAMLLFAVFLWWAAFYATKRMRIGKNLEREEQARRNLAARDEALAQATKSSSPDSSREAD